MNIKNIYFAKMKIKCIQNDNFAKKKIQLNTKMTK